MECANGHEVFPVSSNFRRCTGKTFPSLQYALMTGGEVFPPFLCDSAFGDSHRIRGEA